MFSSFRYAIHSTPSAVISTCSPGFFGAIRTRLHPRGPSLTLRIKNLLTNNIPPSFTARPAQALHSVVVVLLPSEVDNATPILVSHPPMFSLSSSHVPAPTCSPASKQRIDRRWLYPTAAPWEQQPGGLPPGSSPPAMGLSWSRMPRSNNNLDMMRLFPRRDIPIPHTKHERLPHAVPPTYPSPQLTRLPLVPKPHPQT